MSDAGRRAGVVILAGGASRRLGRPKQLLDLGGRPLLQRTIDHANASAAAEVVLVLGCRADEIRAAIEPGRARTIINANWAAGQSTSMLAGLRAIAGDTAAVLFMLGDQPLILPAAIDAVIETWANTGRPVVVPTYDGQPGQPVLFDRSLFPDLGTVTGDQGAREVVRANGARAARVAVPPPSRADDVDDEAAYTAVVEAWRGWRETA